MGTFLQHQGRYNLIVEATTAVSASAAWEIGEANGCCLQIDHGSITGSFTLLQRCGDNAADDTMNWCTITDLTLTNPTGTSANKCYTISDIRANCMKVQYAHSAGTGALNIAIYLKGN